MGKNRFRASPSGVRIADDFRDNLIIDRYDPIFAAMRAKKIKHLRSENSEDVMTWNVFRSLRQINPTIWLPRLVAVGLPGQDLEVSESIVVDLWKCVNPPPSLRLLGDEGPSEIDIAIESPQWVWFIEAKFRSDISSGTTTRPDRNQILRNIDVGSYYAGVRDFYFSLLVVNAQQSPVGAAIVSDYASLVRPKEALTGHRPDGLTNLRAITLLTWGTIGSVLAGTRTDVTCGHEIHVADRALEWLRERRLSSGQTLFSQ